MDKEMRQVYSARVAQANRSELVVIIFEVILEELQNAKKEYEKDNISEYEADLKRAQRFLNELMAGLNYQYAISFNLMSLYIYVNKQIITAMIQKKPQELQEAVMVMERLKVGFVEVSHQDHSKSLMENTQKLYAGLTYGKDKLNEIFVNVDECSRGFRA